MGTEGSRIVDHADDFQICEWNARCVIAHTQINRGVSTQDWFRSRAQEKHRCVRS